VFVKTTPAQISVYGTAAVSQFGFNGGNFGNGSYKPHTGGLTAGAFFTFPSSSRLKAGIDGRVTYSPGYNGGTAYAGTLRLSFVPNRNRFRPYFQIGGGVVSTQLNQTVCNGFLCGTTNEQVTNPVAELGFGLDIRATSHVDIRALDFGVGAGAGANSTHSAGTSMGAGVVYHFRS